MSKPSAQPKHTAQKNQNNESSGQIKIASLLVRLLALLYDFLLVVAMLLVVGVTLIAIGTLAFGMQGSSGAQASELPTWYRYGVLFPAMLASVMGFYGLFWRKSGQTLGMQTWRLQTVDTQGKLLTWSKSLRRCLAACVLPMLCALLAGLGSKQALNWVSAFCFGFLANYVFIWFTPKRLALHDMLSQTLTLQIPARQAGLIADIKQQLDKRKNARKPK